MTKWVYLFGKEKNDGQAGLKNLLGGKGANLAEMASIGLPVPPGFTITTEVCTEFYKNNQTYPTDLKNQVREALVLIEKIIGQSFGDTQNPLLVSVRSGARISMPGMMDTILNLGLNDETVRGLALVSGDERFAFDSYRRFIQMYGNVVLGISSHHFESIIDDLKLKTGVLEDTNLSAEDWQQVISGYKEVIRRELGKEFPQDPEEQLWNAVGAVFGSWMNQRAITYRKLNNIPTEWGTAVNVQAMVFGNMGSDCATGVCFTRNPSTGENVFYGEYLINAQGEDVVAGIRTPQPLCFNDASSSEVSMEKAMPEVFAELVKVRQILEKHYRDMQDIEFTVQKNKLYMLQTRNGKRTAAAGLKIALDMVREGLISKEEALLRIEPLSLDQLLHPTLDSKASKDLLTKGLPASPGSASGKVVFNADEAEEMAHKGEKVVLVRNETSPEDVHGMHAAQGIVTTRGGMTSHAAVVARGMGRPCVAGVGNMIIDEKAQQLTVSGRVIKAYESITLDGSTGEVFQGLVPTVEPKLSEDFSTLMQWADEVRVLGVRANAETAKDAETAMRFGAEGIGLCRTEHMFFDPDRINFMRQMIVAEDEAGRRKALTKLLPFQREDFVSLFKIMGEHPVTIRFLDPPLHEFLPHREVETKEVAAILGISPKVLQQRIEELSEANPMLGYRGCRLGVTFPEIYEMQAEAVFEAALQVLRETGKAPVPEIMIPLVGAEKELEITRQQIRDTAEKVFAKASQAVLYKVGTMIELPRAALLADRIAKMAEFFSFGTNDLTQTTFGYSRDDAGRFLADYLAKGVLSKDPFTTLDREGVGALMRIAKEKGRASNPELKLGICGEHGGDPESVEFCHEIGLNYVSCSPYRVPVAKLAAARAALHHKTRFL